MRPSLSDNATLKTLIICTYSYPLLANSFATGKLPINQENPQKKLSNNYSIFVIITVLLLAMFGLTIVSYVSPVYASTYETIGILGYVYPDGGGGWPVYRFQNWATHAYQYTPTILSPDQISFLASSVAPPFSRLWTISFQTFAWTGPFFSLHPEKQNRLYEFYNWDTTDRAFSTNGWFDPSFTKKGYTPLGPELFGVYKKQEPHTVPLFSYLIDGKYHFYSIHPTEIRALGYLKLLFPCC